MDLQGECLVQARSSGVSGANLRAPVVKALGLWEGGVGHGEQIAEGGLGERLRRQALVTPTFCPLHFPTPPCVSQRPLGLSPSWRMWRWWLGKPLASLWWLRGNHCRISCGTRSEGDEALGGIQAWGWPGAGRRGAISWECGRGPVGLRRREAETEKSKGVVRDAVRRKCDPRVLSDAGGI